jgi:hypothetical protein
MAKIIVMQKQITYEFVENCKTSFISSFSESDEKVMLPQPDPGERFGLLTRHNHHDISVSACVYFLHKYDSIYFDTCKLSSHMNEPFACFPFSSSHTVSMYCLAV